MKNTYDINARELNNLNIKQLEEEASVYHYNKFLLTMRSQKYLTIKLIPLNDK